ncbi:MAG: hypothetical protein ACLSDQ_03260 [Adlercreutzia equolifaciens]
MIAHVRDGRVVKLEGDPDDPMNKGRPAPKALLAFRRSTTPIASNTP